MNGLIERVGVPVFIQTIMEVWDCVFLLIMILSTAITRRMDLAKPAGRAFHESLTTEIIIYYTAILLYNIGDIVCQSAEGDASARGLRVRPAAEFGYYTVGFFMTLFFLELCKRKIARRNGLRRLEYMTLGVQLLQVPGAILLLLTPATGFMYYFDAANYYHRGPLYLVWYVTDIAAFVFIAAVFVTQRVDPLLRRTALVISIVQLAGFLLNFTYSGISFNNLSASIAAFIVYVLHAQSRTEAAVSSVRELEHVKTQLAESRLALEHSKNTVLMAQIQPHFINNALMALCSRCRDYPEIYDSITNFSRYLRSHFEALGDAQMIPFEQEMENIEAYLALETQNFGERLQVEYNIACDDFAVPALSVQPLVENAVRHGVGTYEKGGTVQINARRENGTVIIEIIDDGSGRSGITEQQEKRKGIGIENVRTRLESMSGGTLEIFTGSSGTTARITLTEGQRTEATA